VEELLNRATVESIMMTYNVPAFPKGDVMTFLAMAARSKGKVLKGGIPDKVMAARMVLKDWNKGKIPYYSVPPSSDGMAVDVSGGGGEAVLVSGFSEEFDVNKILAAHDAELMEGLEEKDEMDFVAVSSGAVEGGKNADRVLNYLKGDEDQDSSEGSDEDMEEDEDDAVAANKRMEDAEDFDFGD
jgi:nuclear GTP-binding protein